MPDLNVYNHQKVIPLSADLCGRLHSSACKALSVVLRLAKKGSDLHGLDEVKLALSMMIPLQICTSNTCRYLDPRM